MQNTVGDYRWMCFYTKNIDRYTDNLTVHATTTAQR